MMTASSLDISRTSSLLSAMSGMFRIGEPRKFSFAVLVFVSNGGLPFIKAKATYRRSIISSLMAPIFAFCSS